MAYDLQTSDLFYVDRGGVLFNITWGQILNRENLEFGDLFLVQRGDRLYQVDIEDIWAYVKTIEPTDFLLCERAKKLYHVHLDVPPFFAVRVFGAQSPSTERSGLISFRVAAKELDDSNPKIQKPDGTFEYLTTSAKNYVFDQEGIYRFTGDFTTWKINYANATVDAGISQAKTWESLNASNNDFGSNSFKGIYNLIAVPDGLKVKSLKNAFDGSGINQDCNLEKMDTSLVSDASFAFANTYGGCSLEKMKTSSITNMSSMFSKSDFDSVGLSGWNTSKVTDMSSMFRFTTRFNGDISTWKTSNVTDMSYMFSSAEAFNEVLYSWDTQSVLDMSFMFMNNAVFDKDINGWEVGSVLNFESMFQDALAFDKDLDQWTVSSCVNFKSMFEGAVNFDGSVVTWVTSSATSLDSMFKGAVLFTSDVGGWDVSGITSFAEMFRGAQSFNADLGYWDVSLAENMDYMFKDATGFNQDLSFWCVTRIPDEPDGFNNGALFENIDAYQPDWGVCPEARKVIFFTYDGGGTLRLGGTYASGVSGKISTPLGEETGLIDSWTRTYTEEGSYIVDSENLTRITFTNSTGNWFFKPLSYTSDLEDLSQSFYNCRTFNSDVNWWDTKKVSNLYRTFRQAYAFRSSLTDWNVEQVTNMAEAFYETQKFRSDLKDWSITNVTNLYGTFYNCRQFNSAVENWDVSNVTNLADTFHWCERFNQPMPEWDTFNMTNMYQTLRNAKQFDRDISSWCVINVTDYRYFQQNAKFQQNVDKHPMWNTCPPKLIVPPVIRAKDDTSLICEIGEPIIILANSVTDPQGVIENQWQIKRVGDSLTDFADVPSETNEEYIAQEGDYRVRLKQTITTNDGVRRAYSNEVRVNIGIFGDFLGVKIQGQSGSFIIKGRRSGGQGYIYNDDRQRIIVEEGEFSSVMSGDGVYLVGSEGLEAVSIPNINGFITIDPASYLADVTDLSSFVENCRKFSQDISWLDVSNITNLASAFKGCSNFVQDINGWDTSRVTNFSRVLEGTQVAFGPESWDFSSAEDISFMLPNTFLGDGSGWDFTTVLTAVRPVIWSTNNPIDISDWKFPNATTVSSLFQSATEQNCVGNGSKLDFRSVANASSLFNSSNKVWNGAKWSWGNLSNSVYMFQSAQGEFESGNWSFDSVTNLYRAFYACNAQFSDTSNWKFDSLNFGYQAFQGTNLSGFPGSGSWTFTKLSNAVQMFIYATGNLDMSGWSPQNLNNTSSMFQNCGDLNSEVSVWKITYNNYRAGQSMFYGCTNWLGDLSSWCVTYGSKFSNFDTGAAFQDQPFLQPQWGKCPPLLEVKPVIDNQTNPGLTAQTGDVIYIVSNGVTDNDPTVIYAEQWQRRLDGETTFTDITGQVGPTYTVQDGDGEVRLLQTYTNNGYSYAFSNTILISAIPDFKFIAVQVDAIPTNTRFAIRGLRSEGDGLIVKPDGEEIALEKGSFRRSFDQLGTYFIKNDGYLTNITFRDSGTVTFTVLPESDWSGITNFDYLFYNCSAVTCNVENIPLSTALSLDSTFRDSRSPGLTGDLSGTVFDACESVSYFVSASNLPNLNLNNLVFSYEGINAAGCFSSTTIGPVLDIRTWTISPKSAAAYLSGVTIDSSYVTESSLVFPNHDLSKADDMSNFFSGFNSKGKTVDFPLLDTSLVTNMYALMYSSNMAGVVGINTWDTSNVSKLAHAFRSADFKALDDDPEAFNMQGWDLSNVTDMSLAFYAAINASNLKISSWRPSKVSNFYQCFYSASDFNDDIGDWTTQNATNMTYMFGTAQKFSQDLTRWCVPKVSRLPGNFDYKSGFEGRTDLQPDWGKCPPTIISLPIIEADNGSQVWAPAGSVVTLLEDCVVLPEATAITTYWETVSENGVFYTTAPGSVTNSKTYTVPEGVEVIRVKQVPTNPYGNGGNVYSKSIRVADSEPRRDREFKFTVSGSTPAVGLKVSGFRYGSSTLVTPDGEAVPIDGEFNFWFNDLDGEYTLIGDDLVRLSFLDTAASFTLDPTSYSGDLRSMYQFFHNAKVPVSTDLTWMDTSKVENMSNAFYSVSNISTLDVTGLDVGKVENMNYIFGGGTYLPLGWETWRPVSARNLYACFYNKDVESSKIENWECSNCTNMGSTFQSANFSGATNLSKFSGPISEIKSCFLGAKLISGATAATVDVSGWDTSNVRSMTFTFHSLNEASLEIIGTDSWDTSNVTQLNGTFQSSTVVPVGVGKWNTSKVNNLSSCFINTSIPSNVVLSEWDASNFSNLYRAFYNSTVPATTGISAWDTKKIYNCREVFQNCSLFADVSSWDTATLRDAQSMFSNIKEPFNQDVSNWVTSSMYYASYMFYNNATFNVDCHRWCVSGMSNQNGFADLTELPFYQDKYPQWRKCPPRVVSDPVILDPRGSSGELGHTLELSESAECLDPDAPVSLQWQRKGEIDLNYSDIPGATGETYEIDLDDLRGLVRLKQTFGDDVSGTNRVISNEIYILDFVTPEGMAVTFGQERSGESVNIQIKGFVTQPSTITFEDGTETNVTGNFTVNYAVKGVYFIMTNFLKKISFENTNTTIYINPNSDMGSIEDTSRMFFNCAQFNQNLGWWDVSTVTNMAEMFHYAIAYNGTLNKWDVSNVADMALMFDNAWQFNRGMNEWTPTSVTTTESMFASAYRFNKDLPDWDLSQLTDSHLMFLNAREFNGDISNWSVGSTENMYGMFSGAAKFNQYIGGWITSNVTNMQQMFDDAVQFNQNIGSWLTGNVTNMAAMFEGAASFNQDLSGWCVSPIPGRENFASGAKFEDDLDRQPQWGTCP